MTALIYLASPYTHEDPVIVSARVTWEIAYAQQTGKPVLYLDSDSLETSESEP